MAVRSRARYLAPIALTATIVAAYVIVHDGLTAKPKPAAIHLSIAPRLRGRYARARFYSVRSGDSLTSISRTTGIPIPTLEAMNPNVDPNALRPGQRLRLRR